MLPGLGGCVRTWDELPRQTIHCNWSPAFGDCLEWLDMLCFYQRCHSWISGARPSWDGWYMPQTHVAPAHKYCEHTDFPFCSPSHCTNHQHQALPVPCTKNLGPATVTAALCQVAMPRKWWMGQHPLAGHAYGWRHHFSSSLTGQTCESIGALGSQSLVPEMYLI